MTAKNGLGEEHVIYGVNDALNYLEEHRLRQPSLHKRQAAKILSMRGDENLRAEGSSLAQEHPSRHKNIMNRKNRDYDKPGPNVHNLKSLRSGIDIDQAVADYNAIESTGNDLDRMREITTDPPPDDKARDDTPRKLTTEELEQKAIEREKKDKAINDALKTHPDRSQI
jgi:hypothetical protein